MGFSPVNSTAHFPLFTLKIFQLLVQVHCILCEYCIGAPSRSKAASLPCRSLPFSYFCLGDSVFWVPLALRDFKRIWSMEPSLVPGTPVGHLFPTANPYGPGHSETRCRTRVRIQMANRPQEVGHHRDRTPIVVTLSNG